MVFKVAIPGKIQFKMYRKEPGFFLTRQGDIHYIGGSEVLPPPLETEKENAVISDLGTEYDNFFHSPVLFHRVDNPVPPSAGVNDVLRYDNNRIFLQSNNLSFREHSGT